MQKQLKQMLVLLSAMICLVLGVLGIFLPFLQGFIFLLMGTALLSIWSPKMRGWIFSYTQRHPRAHRVFLKTESWLQKIIGKL